MTKLTKEVREAMAVEMVVVAESVVAGTLTVDNANALYAKKVGVNPVVYAMVNGMVTDLTTVFTKAVSKEVTASDLNEFLISLYVGIAEGEYSPLSPIEALTMQARNDVKGEIDTLQEQVKELAEQNKALMAQLQTTNTNNGGMNMNQQVQFTEAEAIAALQAGTATPEEFKLMMAHLNNKGGMNMNNVTAGVGNMVNAAVGTAGQVVVGTVDAASQLINSLMGTVTGAAAQVGAGTGKLSDMGMNLADTAHTTIGTTINTSVQLSGQAVKVGAEISTVAIDTAAHVGKELIKAGEEIANTLIVNAGLAAHTVNNNVNFATKNLMTVDKAKKAEIKPVQQLTYEEMKAMLNATK